MSSKSRLLLVEDDPTLGVTLKERLISEGYSVHWASTAEDARKQFGHSWDLVILDVGLPDGSGFELASEWKGSVPFLFVTALSDAEHRLRGFELGAEEYIPKPFHLKELLLRVKHVLENHPKKKIFEFGDTIIDLEAMAIKVAGEVIRPAVKDFQVLALLLDKSPKVLSRDEILNAVWGDETGNLRSVDNAMVRLRSILPNSPIRSVRGVGYQWENL